MIFSLKMILCVHLRLLCCRPFTVCMVRAWVALWPLLTQSTQMTQVCWYRSEWWDQTQKCVYTERERELERKWEREREDKHLFAYVISTIWHVVATLGTTCFYYLTNDNRLIVVQSIPHWLHLSIRWGGTNVFFFFFFIDAICMPYPYKHNIIVPLLRKQTNVKIKCIPLVRCERCERQWKPW